MLFLKFCVFFSVFVCAFSQVINVVSINTKKGEILGQRGELFTTFLGIPYGVVDDTNPRGPASQHPDFEFPFKAFTDLPLCPQFISGKLLGTIHCLQLNIYTPNDVTSEAKLPVMVYIHGGAFVEGNSRLESYSPKFLVRHNVIVVTIHYRLGAFGFLCPNKKEYRNQGLKDQYLALKWVKNVIKDFGGDDENVSLFGHSAGSIAADLLMLNTEGLFNKVILQSGNAANPTLIEDVDARHKNTENDDDITEEDFEHLLLKTNISYVFDSNFKITVKACFDDTFIKKNPDSEIENFKILIGNTNREGLFFYPDTNNRNFTEKYDFASVLQNSFANIDVRANELVKNFYLENGVTEFASDYTFNYPAERSIRYYLKNNAVVYRYLFNYEGGRNHMKIMKNITASGTTHADELGYIFDMNMFNQNITKEDQLMIDRITLLWTNFAKYGDPTPTPTAVLPIKWTPTTKEEMTYLDLNSALVMRPGTPFEKNTAFWDLFYYHYGKYYTGINLDDIDDYENNGSVVNGMSYFCMALIILVCSF